MTTSHWQLNNQHRFGTFSLMFFLCDQLWRAAYRIGKWPRRRPASHSLFSLPFIGPEDNTSIAVLPLRNSCANINILIKPFLGTLAFQNPFLLFPWLIDLDHHFPIRFDSHGQRWRSRPLTYRRCTRCSIIQWAAKRAYANRPRRRSLSRRAGLASALVSWYFCSRLIFRSRVLLWFLFRYNPLRPSSTFQICVRFFYVNAGSNYRKGFSISGGYPVDGFGVLKE